MILFLSCLCYFLIGLVIAVHGEGVGWSRPTQYVVGVGLCVVLSLVIAVLAP